MKNHTCGFIRETRELLYCCPQVNKTKEIEDIGGIFSRMWTNDMPNECLRVDHTPGECIELKQCHRMNAIVKKAKREEYHVVKGNRCKLDDRNYFVCCAQDEILNSKQNECYDFDLKKGECSHYSHCPRFQKEREFFTEASVEYWKRSQCKPSTKTKKKVKLKNYWKLRYMQLLRVHNKFLNFNFDRELMFVVCKMMKKKTTTPKNQLKKRFKILLQAQQLQLAREGQQEGQPLLLRHLNPKLTFFKENSNKRAINLKHRLPIILNSTTDFHNLMSSFTKSARNQM